MWNFANALLQLKYGHIQLHNRCMLTDSSFGVWSSWFLLSILMNNHLQFLLMVLFQNKPGEDQILKMFQQPASEKVGHVKNLRRGQQDLHCIFWLFQKMHERHIKPNVITFLAILNASSRCNSYDDDAKVLDTLRLFDSQVYGVVHDWLLNMHMTLLQGSELPKIVNWGKHGKVVGEGTLKRTIETLLNRMGYPFRFAEHNMGRLTSFGDLVATWLRQLDVINMLGLYDVFTHS
ncbi:hypothetical protein KIW84_041807 [Lathyrus oleraceus]|uniref:Smr domain-containing protein n=1 Tax=Pisum sativum TaxID=3888 RepID=A0A9D5AS64_PEA|nr:hypothetical protein KIW84_041807 [Pisum sativum]